MAILRRSPKEILFLIVIAAELVGITGLTMLIYAVNEYMGGMNWLDESTRYNHLHSLFMPIGMVFLLGNGMIMFRINRTASREKMKMVHMSLFILAFLISTAGMACGILGRIAMEHLPHFITVHSWLGLLAYIMLLYQVISGAAFFLCKGAKPEHREYIIAVHAFFGVCTALLSILVTCIGILSKSNYYLNNYDTFPLAGMFMNTAGILLLAFTTAAFYITVCPYFEWEKAEEM